MLELPRCEQCPVDQKLKDLLRATRPLILILLEPKVSGPVAVDVCKKIRLNRWSRSKAEGFSGGIWMVWSNEDVKIEIRYAHKFFLHASINAGDGKEWELTAVYASPITSRRRGMWIKLDKMNIKKPWLLLGDFNCILKAEERSSSSGVGEANGPY